MGGAGKREVGGQTGDCREEEARSELESGPPGAQLRLVEGHSQGC